MTDRSAPQSSNFSYQVGGSLPADFPAYVERKADRDLYELLKKSEYCFVFNSRQMGKSSLRVRAIQKLSQDGVACATIDPQTRGTKLREDQWYAGTIKRLIDDLHLSAQIDFPSWWRDLETQSISAVERFFYFIDRVLLTEISQNIVIFVEEIDNLLGLTFDADGFFILIRSFYERRAEDPRYQRLTFAFLGVATPSDLIVSKHSSSFNIGRSIEMSGFQPDEVEPLLQGLIGKVNDPPAVLNEVLRWTGGQPFLTQKVLDLVVKSTDKSSSPPALVERVIAERIVNNWEGQDVPPHLKTIRDRVIRSDEKIRGQLLGMYRQILDRQIIPADESMEQLRLRLTGLVVKREGRLEVYNPIYAQVFDRAWVDRALGELRPPFYAEAFRAWQDIAEDQKESFLLSGQILRDVEAWAKGKRLSDEDDRFLDNSQRLERRLMELLINKQEESTQNDSISNHNNISAHKHVSGSRKVIVSTMLAITTTGLVAVYPNAKDRIECQLGGFNQLCPPLPASRLQQPQKIGDVLYYPYLKAKDKNGKSAEINMAVLSDKYEWAIGSNNQVKLKGADKFVPISTLIEKLKQDKIFDVMGNPNRIISLGMASCEGGDREEEGRALNRAQTIRTEIVKKLFEVKEYPILNLGQYKSDICQQDPAATSFQRSLAIVGIRKEDKGLIVKEAVYERLRKTIEYFNLDNYSNGNLNKFNLVDR